MSPELKILIDAIIADGVITPKERAVLHARASKEGISVDEIDVLVEGMLAKKNSEAKTAPGPPRPVPPPPPSVTATPKKREVSYGVVHKCPNCGALVESGKMSCEACGYMFRGVEANSSVQRISDLINAASVREYHGSLSSSEATRRFEAINNIIKNFPVPSTKEDLLEFILFAKSNGFESTFTNHHAAAYRSKYYECVEKAKLYFPDDPQLKAVVADAEALKSNKWKNMHPLAKMGVMSLIAMVFLVLLMLLIGLAQ